MRFSFVRWSSLKLPLLVAALWFAGTGSAAAQPFCSAPYLVDQTFAAATRWRLCWEVVQREGLVINRAFYTDRGGIEREVMFRGGIAQIHVPYHPGSPRILDLTTGTSGLGANSLDLAASECPTGTLLNPGGLFAGTRVCRQLKDRGLAHKYGHTSMNGQDMLLWISSQLGEYNYITEWIFADDGTIHAHVGLTGRLSFFQFGVPSCAPTCAGWDLFGFRLNDESAAQAKWGLSHMHNIYFRFDLDIGGGPSDALQGIFSYPWDPSFGSSPSASCSTPGECNFNYTYNHVVEGTDQRWSPFLSWRVYDTTITNLEGRTIGYEIVPHGARWDAMATSFEPWSKFELFVTNENPCELLATQNQPPYIPATCPASTPTDVLAMTAQHTSVLGADNVIWYVHKLAHHPRDEDETNMLVEKQGVELRPRSWRHKNTLEP
jgi:primary-amine oxidase